MKINKEWHEKHKIPKCPTKEERIHWHIEHARNCQCRPISEKLQKEIDELDSGSSPE